MRLNFYKTIKRTAVGVIAVSMLVTPAYATTTDNISTTVNQNEEASIESSIYNINEILKSIETLKSEDTTVSDDLLQKLGLQIINLQDAVKLSGKGATNKVISVLLEVEEAVKGLDGKSAMKVIIYVTLAKDLLNITDNVSTITLEQAKASDFLDIQSHWGKSNIDYLIGRGSINGYPDGTFRPDGTITRAEFVKIALGSVMSVETMQGGHWATLIFDEAINQEILKIGEMPESNWDKPITRYEMTMIMTRIAEKLLNEEKTATVGIANILTDYNKVQQNQYYTTYVEQAYMKGLIKGYEDGSFQGTKTGSRAEACTMLARMIDTTKREKVDTSVVVVKPPVVVGVGTLYQTDATRGEAKAGDTFVKADGTKVVLKVDPVSGVLGAGQGVAIDLGRTVSTSTFNATVYDDYQATGNTFGPIAGDIYRINPNTGEGHWTGDWVKIFNTTEPTYSGTTDGELSADKNWVWTTIYRGGSWEFVVNIGFS